MGRAPAGPFSERGEGEEWVAHELAFLPSNYTVFNGLRLGGKHNFDHIIVAPTGIFVVETKNWQGSVEFKEGRLVFPGGKEPGRPPLRQVKDAAAELIRFIDDAGCGDLPVHSVLCFLKTGLPEDIMNVNGVVVCKGEKLTEVLQETFDEPVAASIRDQVVDELRKVIE
ncbi:NERD domain-containing protein [Verrucomicrobia bacterium S94]|nr:NERD domain-containing protein [Verrucomicrobia bacterium S94]